jgi:hypothetical protein
MNEQNIVNALDALSKVEVAAGAMSPTGWAALARAANEHVVARWMRRLLHRNTRGDGS